MHILDCCDDLITPITNLFVLADVKPSKKNKNSVSFIFQHPDDYKKSDKTYESVIWTFTKGAVLPPCVFAKRGEDGEFNGQESNKSVYLGGVQLMSLIAALEDKDLGDIDANIVRLDQDQLVAEVKKYIGLLVETPLSGRVKGKDNVIRTQFSFPKWEYSKDPRDNTTCLEDISKSFHPVSLDTQLSFSKESARFRKTRPDTAVVPAGAEDGDEILDS